MHNVAWNALFCVTTISRALFLALVMKVNTASCGKNAGDGAAWHAGNAVYLQGEEIGMTNPHFTRITDYREWRASICLPSCATMVVMPTSFGNPRQ